MKPFIPLFGVLGLLSLAGCATQNVNTVERAQPQANVNYVSDKRVSTDYSLSNTIHVVGINEGVVSGLKKIQVSLENLKNRDVTIRYRIEWIDANGMQVQSPTDFWKPLPMKGRETSLVSAVAPTPQVVDFVLKLQENSAK